MQQPFDMQSTRIRHRAQLYRLPTACIFATNGIRARWFEHNPTVIARLWAGGPTSAEPAPLGLESRSRRRPRSTPSPKLPSRAAIGSFRARLSPHVYLIALPTPVGDAIALTSGMSRQR